MKAFFKEFKNFVINWRFIVPLLLCTAVGYGYVLNHFAIGIDDLTRPRYIYGEMLAQGRVSGTFISFLFGFTEYRPFWEDFVSIIFIFLAGIVGAIFLKRVSGGRINSRVCTFFACFLVTYPIINEIFLYAGSGLNMGVGYTLTFIAIMLMESFFERKKVYGIILCTLIMIFNFSLYESFALVYVCCVCGTLFIKQLISNGNFPQCELAETDGTENKKASERNFKTVLVEIIWYVVPLAAGVILEFFISNGVRILAGVVTSDASASDIVFPPNLYETVVSVLINYVLNAMWYLPILVLMLSGVVLFIMTLRQSVKYKKHIYWLYFCGMLFSILALPILQSGGIKYRNSQSLVVFCIFPLTLLFQKLIVSKKLWIRIMSLSIAGLLILCQSASLLKWFYVDYQQSEHEKSVMLKVAEDLSANHDLSKTVIFAGEYTLPDEILDYKYARKDDIRYKALAGFFDLFGHELTIETPSDNHGFHVAQTHHGSVITWGCYAFDEGNTELLRIYKHYGYEFVQGTYEQVIEAYDIYETMSEQGKLEKSNYEIIDNGDYIAVIFS